MGHKIQYLPREEKTEMLKKMIKNEKWEINKLFKIKNKTYKQTKSNNDYNVYHFFEFKFYRDS